LSLGPEGQGSSTEDEGDGDGDGDSDSGGPASDLLLMYNSVQGYCSTINEL
jgi:hypothetical protein